MPHLLHRSSHVSSQTISRWIVTTIHLAYQLAQKRLPLSIKAHSTRAVAASTAFPKGVPLHDTWATSSMFAAVVSDFSISRCLAVLSNVFQTIHFARWDALPQIIEVCVLLLLLLVLHSHNKVVYYIERGHDSKTTV